MKVVHIEARIKSKVKLPKSFIDKLPKTVVVFTTIQLMSSFDSCLKEIENSGRKTITFKTGHTRYKGQILGCNVQQGKDYTDEEFDAYVYIGDGLFHPKALVWKNENKKVFAYNPFTQEQQVVDNEDIQRIKKKNKGALSTFYMSTKIGVLVTTKPGQFYLKRALELRDEYPEKEFFYILDNTIDFNSLEDFSFIDCWINTACPRIGFDDSIKISKPIINMEDVKKTNTKRARVDETIADINSLN